MKPFAYARAAGKAEALRASARPGTRLLAGGTDLVRELKSRRIEVETLLDIGRVPEWRGLVCDARRGLRAGAAVKLAELEADPQVAALYPALHEAVAGAATPQIRNVATLGGSLLQRPSCWYYRGGFDCWLKGQERCAAAGGDNRFGGIFAGGVCAAGHPSDSAAALLALGARVRLARGRRERSVPLAEIYAIPSASDPREHRLRPGEVVTAIEIDPPGRGARSVYLRARDRATWSFALVGVAAAGRVRRGRLGELRVFAAGVGPIPWLIADPGRPAEGAAPGPTSAYKVAILEALVRRAVASLSAERDGQAQLGRRARHARPDRGQKA